MIDILYICRFDFSLKMGQVKKKNVRNSLRFYIQFGQRKTSEKELFKFVKT